MISENRIEWGQLPLNFDKWGQNFFIEMCACTSKCVSSKRLSFEHFTWFENSWKYKGGEVGNGKKMKRKKMRSFQWSWKWKTITKVLNEDEEKKELRLWEEKENKKKIYLSNCNNFFSNPWEAVWVPYFLADVFFVFLFFSQWFS